MISSGPILCRRPVKCLSTSKTLVRGSYNFAGTQHAAAKNTSVERIQLIVRKATYGTAIAGRRRIRFLLGSGRERSPPIKNGWHVVGVSGCRMR